jgi:hypothetical protein
MERDGGEEEEEEEEENEKNGKIRVKWAIMVPWDENGQGQFSKGPERRSMTLQGPFGESHVHPHIPVGVWSHCNFKGLEIISRYEAI